MPATTLPPRSEANFPMSEARQNAIRRAKSHPSDDIQAVRNRITQMGGWDSFLDWAVRDRFKEKALKLIADKVILDMTTADDPTQAEQLETRRLDANLNLLNLLSSRGKPSLYGSHEITEAGVLFKPDTEDSEIDALLRITVPPQSAGQIIRSAQGPDAAAIAFQKWANKSTTLEQRAELYAYEAHAWEIAKASTVKPAQDYDDKIVTAWRTCALACDASAKVRVSANAETPENAVEEFRAGAKAAKSAAFAWQHAKSAAEALGNEQAAHYQDKATASDVTAAKYLNDVHALAADAWLRRAAACSGKATFEMRRVSVADPEDARGRCASAAKWVKAAAIAYERAAMSAVHAGDKALAAESRARSLAEHRYAYKLEAAAKQDNPVATMDPRPLH